LHVRDRELRRLHGPASAAVGAVREEQALARTDSEQDLHRRPPLVNSPLRRRVPSVLRGSDENPQNTEATARRPAPRRATPPPRSAVARGSPARPPRAPVPVPAPR